MTNTETFSSVWDAVADTPGQAAERCGVTQRRINELLRGRVSRFSLDALMNIAAALDRRVHLALAVA